MRASWGAGVPQGCCIREAGTVSRRQRLDVASARLLWLRRVGFDGAVHRGAADTEELGDLEGAVLAAVHQGDEVCLLTAVELGLLAAKSALDLRDLHTLSGAESDQVGLELGDH